MWLLRQVGDPLTLSKALQPVAMTWAYDIRRRLDDPIDGTVAAIAAAIPDPSSCPVCDVQREAGATYLLGFLTRRPCALARQRI
jgi:hypothetical protein